MDPITPPNPTNPGPNTANTPPDALRLLIRNRERMLYNDVARAVTSFNDKGKFDILGHHTNFITIIKKQIIITRMDNKRLEMKITMGVLRVEANQVTIFLGILVDSPDAAPDQPPQLMQK